MISFNPLLDTSNKVIKLSCYYHMPIAYVLVLCDFSDSEYEITRIEDQLSKLPSVTEVDRVDGPYDIIVKLSGDSIDTIKESIGKHMTRIRGIQSTLTLMAE
jgi:DNA-binding Lrp family transcriptional regulator